MNLEQEIDNIRNSINSLNEKLDQHMQRVEPYLQGAAGLGILWKGIIAIGGLFILWGQIKGLFMHK